MIDALRTLGEYLEANPEEPIFTAIEDLCDSLEILVPKSQIEHAILLAMVQPLYPEDSLDIVERAIRIEETLSPDPDDHTYDTNYVLDRSLKSSATEVLRAPKQREDCGRGFEDALESEWRG